MTEVALLQETHPYLHYRPTLDLRRELAFIVYQTGTPLAEEYQISSELSDAASILATHLLAQVDQLIDATTDLSADLAGCLTDGPASITGFFKAQAQGGQEVLHDFLEYHCSSLEGSVQGELLVALVGIGETLVDTAAFVRDVLIIAPDEDAEQTRYVEMAATEYEHPGSIDRLALAYEAQLKYQIKTRLDNIQDFCNGCHGIAASTVEDSFGGALVEGITALAESGPKIMEALIDILQVGFIHLGERGLRLHEQQQVFGNRELCARLQVAAASLREMRVNSATPVIDWLGSLETEEPHVSTILETALEGLTAIDRELDRSMLDLAKHEANENLLRTALLANITARKEARQVRKLCMDMSRGFDFGTTQLDEEVARFINANVPAPDKELCAD